MEVTKCWKIVEFPKIKMKTASHLKEIIQIIQLPPNPNPPPPIWPPLPEPLPHPTLTPHQIKSYYVSGINIFLRRYTQIYRHLLFKKWCSENVFLAPSWNMFAGKFVKSERFLAVLREHIVFNVKWVEVHKMSGYFWPKLYCKRSDLFH